MSNDDPRRQKRWNGLIGRLYIDDESWGASEGVEDAEGRSHHSHVHGHDKDKADAIALVEAMIRDGRMPSPQEAKRQREQRLQRDRERRAKAAVQIRRRQQREERDRLREASETPLYEAIADAFDFDDPELWKSIHSRGCVIGSSSRCAPLSPSLNISARPGGLGTTKRACDPMTALRSPLRRSRSPTSERGSSE
jgi:hypothetical protein